MGWLTGKCLPGPVEHQQPPNRSKDPSAAWRRRQAARRSAHGAASLTLVKHDQAIKVLAAPLDQLLEPGVAAVCGRRGAHADADACIRQHLQPWGQMQRTCPCRLPGMRSARAAWRCASPEEEMREE